MGNIFWAAWNRLLLVGGACFALALVLTTSSSALAAGAPVTVGTPGQAGAPSVAVDASGNAIVAWANTAVHPNTVQYCVVAVSGTGCAHSGTLAPANAEAFVDKVQVVITDSTVVILADVFGGTAANTKDYIPVQEWQSTDGGSSFAIVAGGKSVANGIASGDDTVPIGGVVLPGSIGVGVSLGFGWVSAANKPPTFNAFPLASPTECSTQTCPGGSNPPYALLQASTEPDRVTNLGGQYVSTNADGQAGVMGIFNTNFTTGSLGCSGSLPFGTAFIVGGGVQTPTNNYNVSPGSPNTAWHGTIAMADCNTEYAAATAGPSGYGILATDDNTKTTFYHALTGVTGKFDTARVTVSGVGETQSALSQDAAGGIYATFVSNAVGNPLSVAYSRDGGKNWTGPNTLNANADARTSYATSAVNAGGQGWAAWLDNGSVITQSFTATDATPPVPTPTPAPVATPVVTPTPTPAPTPAPVAPPAAMVGDSATIVGSTATISVSCPTIPCTVKTSINATETTASGARATKTKKKTKTKVVTLGTATTTIKTKGTKKIAVKLNAAGKKYFASHHSRVKTQVIVSETVAGKPAAVTKKTVSFAPAPKAKAKKKK